MFAVVLDSEADEVGMEDGLHDQVDALLGELGEALDRWTIRRCATFDQTAAFTNLMRLIQRGDIDRAISTGVRVDSTNYKYHWHAARRA